MNRLLLALLLAPLAACGGGGDSPAPTAPTPPAPTTTGVAVTLSSPVRMGQTAQATGTETLSNGQTRSIASGWLSDATAVATVTNAGLVSGVSNGRATIYVVAGGVRGQQQLRVVPDYQGRWSGTLRITSCTETGIFHDIDFCDDNPVGATYSYSLNLTQSGEQLSAVVDYGPGFIFPSIAAPIGEDGASAFAPSISVTDSGVTVTVEAAFNINSTRVSELTGTDNEVWRLPNFNGEGRLTQDLVSTTRTGLAALSSPSEVSARRLRVLRKLAQRAR